MPAVLVDDHLLVRVLAATAPPRVERARRRGELWTTGLWYYRAARALGSANITGSLTGELAGLPEPTRARAVRDLAVLPDDVGLLSLRDLVPTMSELSRAHALNLLALEALAAAVQLEADMVVAAEDDGPKLRAAVKAAGLRYATA